MHVKQCHHTQRYKNRGASGTGFSHWWFHKRVIMGMIPLAILMLVTFLVAADAGYHEMVEWMSRPWIAVSSILFVMVFFYHASVEIKGCIQDYIDPEWFARGFVVAVQLAAVFVAALAVFSILAISLRGAV
jgi:succinate dehydrogenase hydrophobic membrane anchor protein